MSYSDVSNGVVVGRSEGTEVPNKPPKGVWMEDRFINANYDEVLYSREGPTFSVEGGMALYTYTIVPHEESLARDNKLKDLIEKLNSKHTKLSKDITANYPDEIVKTWGQQKFEAVSFRGDPNNATPMLDAMGIGRGKSRIEVVEAIEIKEALYANAIGIILGRYQAIWDMMDAAEDLDELLRIESEELPQGW